MISGRGFIYFIQVLIVGKCFRTAKRDRTLWNSLNIVQCFWKQPAISWWDCCQATPDFRLPSQVLILFLTTTRAKRTNGSASLWEIGLSAVKDARVLLKQVWVKHSHRWGTKVRVKIKTNLKHINCTNTHISISYKLYICIKFPSFP